MNGLTAAGNALEQGDKTLDAYTRNLIKTLFGPELAAAAAETSSANGGTTAIGTATGAIAAGIDKFGDDVLHDITGWKEDMNKLLKPVSSATGETLGALNGVLKDPLGSIAGLPNTIAGLIGRVNPTLGANLEASIKNVKALDLANLPSQIMGSARTLAGAVDKLIALPFAYLADLYNGLMEIMDSIADLADALMSKIFDFLFGPQGLFDSILPLQGIMDLLGTVNQLLAIANVVAGFAGGFGPAGNIIGQISSFTSQASSLIRNPQSLIMQYVPAEVTTYMSYLRNPESLIDSLIPPNVKAQLGAIAQIPGLGFVGNMGFGLSGVLSTIQSGVLTSVLNEFEQQLGIVGINLNQPSKSPPVVDTTKPAEPVIKGSQVNPTVASTHGVAVPTKPKPYLIPTKNENQGPVIPGERFQYADAMVGGNPTFREFAAQQPQPGPTISNAQRLGLIPPR
jgi:hypothetical protein